MPRGEGFQLRRRQDVADAAHRGEASVDKAEALCAAERQPSVMAGRARRVLAAVLEALPARHAWHRDLNKLGVVLARGD